MTELRRTLSATGLAFIALGVVAFGFGLVAHWLDVRQPIDYGMPIGGALALTGLGVLLANRSPRVPDHSEHASR